MLAALVALTLHSPQADLPKVERPLAWLGRSILQARPSNWRRWGQRSLGIEDVLSTKEIAKVGIDVTQPIHHLTLTRQGHWLIEASVKDPARIDAWIKRLPRGRPPVVEKAKWDAASLVTPPREYPLLVARVKSRVVLMQIRDPAQVGALFAEGERVRRPSKKRGQVTLEIKAPPQLEWAVLGLDLGETLTLTGRLRVGFVYRLMAGELLGSKKARRLLDGMPDRVASVSAFAGPPAVREALVQLGLTTKQADAAKRIFAGEHAVVLTENGTLVGAARLSGSASKKQIDGLMDLLRTIEPSLVLERSGAFLLGWFPGKKQNAVTSWEQDPSQLQLGKQKRGGAAVEIVLEPARTIRALRKRGRARNGPRIGLAQLTMVEAIYGPVLRAMAHLSLNATQTRGVISIDAKIRL